MPDLRPPFNDEVRKERVRRYVDGKCDLYSNRLSVLRTSRALYQEVSCELYRPELCFCVCPNEENVTAKGLPSSSMCHFINTPLDRFCRIAVEIQAPVEDDPEQVLMGRHSVWRVVSLILDFIEERGQRSNHSHQNLLPHLDIRLLDRSCATWFDLVANNWQRSIPGYSEEDDIDFFLSPFGSVRGVGCVHVHLPHGLEDYFSMRELVTGMQLPDELGTRLHLPHYFDSDQDCDNDCNDDVIFFDEEEKFNKLQDACSFISLKMHALSWVEEQLESSRQGKRSKNLTSKPIIRWLRRKTHHHGRNTVGSRNALVAAHHFRHVDGKLEEIMPE